jgi:hypothetical protein
VRIEEERMQANDAQTLVLCVLADGPRIRHHIAIEELTGERLGRVRITAHVGSESVACHGRWSSRYASMIAIGAACMTWPVAGGRTGRA